MSTPQVISHIQLKNILFATDFSAASELALPFVKALARHYASTVLVVHVYLPEPQYEIPLDRLPPELAPKRTEAVERMNTFVQVHELKDLPHKVLLQEGDVWPALEQMIDKYEADLIVVGTRGRSDLKHILLGSVAEEIVRRSPCPVLTVGPHALHADGATRGEFRHILYATSFSPASEHALVYALSLAQESQAQLTLLHVIEEMPMDVPTPDPQTRVPLARRRLHDLLPEGVGLAREPELMVQVGAPADIILQVAKTHSADVIVMGVHHSATPHASAHAPWRTAHQVIREAHCPVLTVRS